NTIVNWSPTTTYFENDIVFFQDPTPTPTDNSGYYISVTKQNNLNFPPDEHSWAWRKMGYDYQSNTKYAKGSILFYDSVFYRAKKETWSSPPAADAWERMDRKYAEGNTYSVGSIVYTESNSAKTYYYAIGAITTYQPPASWTNWKQLGMDWSAINAANKYEIGEVVFNGGEYWRALKKGHLGTPTQGANWSRISQPNPTPFDPDKTDYAVWDYVVYNSK